MVDVALTVGIVSTCIFALSWLASVFARPSALDEYYGDISMAFKVIATIWALSLVVSIIAFAVAAIGSVWK